VIYDNCSKKIHDIVLSRLKDEQRKKFLKSQEQKVGAFSSVF
jgi:hypothetical protein